MRIKPAKGMKVRCPITKEYIPDGGYTVDDDDLFWARRLRDKDVEIVTTEVAKPSAAKSSVAPQVVAINDGSTK